MSSCGNEAKLGFHVLSSHFSLTRRGDAPEEKSLFTYSRILSDIYHCFVASSPQATFPFFHTHHLSSRDLIRSFLLLQEVPAWPWSFYKWMFHMAVLTWWFCSSFVMEEQAWWGRNEHEKYIVRVNVTPGQMKLLY